MVQVPHRLGDDVACCLPRGSLSDSRAFKWTREVFLLPLRGGRLEIVLEAVELLFRGDDRPVRFWHGNKMGKEQEGEGEDQGVAAHLMRNGISIFVGFDGGRK